MTSEARFVSGDYGAVVERLIDVRRRCELGPGRPDAAAQDMLAGLTAADVGDGRTIRDAEMAAACLAGLWLWHDFLDESHRVSQSIETPTGSFWHGIMHRREPDASNAKYWFRRVGEHAVYDDLAATAGQIAAAAGQPAEFLSADGSWDAAAFVDACEEARGQQNAAEELCCDVQQAEWFALFDYCFRAAFEDA